MMLLQLHLGQYSHLLTAMYPWKPCNTIKAALDTSPAFPIAQFHPISFLNLNYLVNSLSPIASLYKCTNFPQKIILAPSFVWVQQEHWSKYFFLKCQYMTSHFVFSLETLTALLASWTWQWHRQKLIAHIMPVVKTLLKINLLKQMLFKKIHFWFCKFCNYSD